MENFVQLFTKIDGTTKTNEKVAALVQYFKECDELNALWTIALFTGRHPARIATSTELKTWAAELAGVPLWLFEESYHVVGDLSETISSIIPLHQHTAPKLALHEYIKGLIDHRGTSPEQRRRFITDTWLALNREERFVFNKLTSGTFRVGVSDKLMVKALAQFTGHEENVVAHQLMGNWHPNNTTFKALLYDTNPASVLSRPYPFYLAYGLECNVNELGDIEQWQLEYKWDGIRCQLIKRSGEVYIWSRGEELITDRFPELKQAASFLPDNIVIDGELVVYKDGVVQPFQLLQTRISRKQITPRLMKEVPVAIFAYDLLEVSGTDIRKKPLKERRLALEAAIKQTNHPALVLSEIVYANTWDEVAAVRQQSRQVNSEGLMIKHSNSVYDVGRKKGGWWKWKVDPMSLDVVMIYAISGHGRRANLYTDYTFAIWNDEGVLVPIAKAYSGLTDEEILQVDSWIRKNTIDKFGPVRSVKPELVFEIGFEGINVSGRHKSGLALRFPRILRLRTDKLAADADTMEQARQLMQVTEGHKKTTS